MPHRLPRSDGLAGGAALDLGIAVLAGEIVAEDVAQTWLPSFTGQTMIAAFHRLQTTTTPR